MHSYMHSFLPQMNIIYDFKKIFIRQIKIALIDIFLKNFERVFRYFLTCVRIVFTLE